MWGLLEHRIRSLPHVVSCSVAPQGLTVLVDLGGDAAAIRAVVEQYARSAGYSEAIRVIGGKDTNVRPFVTPRRAVAASALVASVAGAATLLTTVFGPSVPVPDPGGSGRPPVERKPVAGGPAIPGPDTPQDDPERTAPAETKAGRQVLERLRVVAAAQSGPGQLGRKLDTRIADAIRSGSDVSGESPDRGDDAPEDPVDAPEDPVEEAPEPQPEASKPKDGPAPKPGGRDKKARSERKGDRECKTPPDRGAPRARKGRHKGNGPRPWSRSVLLPPRGCDRR